MIKRSEPLKSGVVLSTTRRLATILTPEYEVISAQLSTKMLEVTVGDNVAYSDSRGRPFVEQVLEPVNCLTRSYFGQVRRIVANVDHLFIGAAVPPLFNTTFIDRLLAIARLEQIPATLLVNKIDLGIEHATRVAAIYDQLGVDLLLTSAISGEGIDLLKQRLASPELKVVVLAGISGVGKSTIINLLIPQANQRVGIVSERTGQGKQTTAQSIGHLLERESGTAPLVVVDLPGIQSFGTAHLQRNLVTAGFVEIEEIGQQCEFSDCSHTKEQSCAVKQALNDGRISASRYHSYCEILAEIDAEKSY